MAMPEAQTVPSARKGRQIRWYRSPVDAAMLRALSRRSNIRGAMQTVGYLGVYAMTTGLSIYSAAHWRWHATAGLIFLHGMVTAFMINGVHELGHNTVFRSKWLNALFVRVLAF